MANSFRRPLEIERPSEKERIVKNVQSISTNNTENTECRLVSRLAIDRIHSGWRRRVSFFTT